MMSSTSAENNFLINGKGHGVTYGATQDNDVIRELFNNLLESAMILHKAEEPVLNRIKEVLPKIPGHKIGKQELQKCWYKVT